MEAAAHIRSDAWLAKVFSAQAVARGAVVRRAVAWVEHEIGRERFVAEVRQRGFHLFEAGGQFIVICNRGPVRRVV